MYNKTIVELLSETKDDIISLLVQSRVEIGATILFLFLITRGRKTWLNFFAFCFFFEGFQYVFYPRTLKIWTSFELDDTHLMPIRYMGLALLAWNFGYFLLSKSTDSTTESSYLLAWTVTMLSNLMVKGYQLTHPPPEEDPFRVEPGQMTSMFYITLLCALGPLFHTFKVKDWGGFWEQPSHANFHLRLQFVLLLFMGIVSYAMPHWTLKMMMTDIEKVDSVHTFFLRSCATFMLGMAIMANRSANFLRTDDRDAVVFSQLLFFVLVSILGWTDLASRWSGLTWGRVVFQLVFNAVLILNATGALDSDFSVVKKVVIPRFKVIPQDLRSFFKFKQL